MPIDPNQLGKVFPVHTFLYENLRFHSKDSLDGIALKVTIIAVIVFQKLYLLTVLAEFIVFMARATLHPVKPFIEFLLFPAFPKYRNFSY